jgi:hypothetical protein
MFYLFFLFLQKISHLLASRVESKSLKVIREALQNHAIRRGISLNNNEWNNLWKI